jgi:hypothetical protein
LHVAAAQRAVEFAPEPPVLGLPLRKGGRGSLGRHHVQLRLPSLERLGVDAQLGGRDLGGLPAREPEFDGGTFEVLIVTRLAARSALARVARQVRGGFIQGVRFGLAHPLTPW